MFVKGYVSNCSEDFFVIKRVKNILKATLAIITDVISNFNDEEIFGKF